MTWSVGSQASELDDRLGGLSNGGEGGGQASLEPKKGPPAGSTRRS